MYRHIAKLSKSLSKGGHSSDFQFAALHDETLLEANSFIYRREVKK